MTNKNMADKNKKSLIKYSGNVLARTEKSIELVNKLLVKDINDLLILFKDNPRVLIRVISNYCPLSYEILDKYEDILDWDKVCENESIPWSKKIYDRFKDKLLSRIYDWSKENPPLTNNSFSNLIPYLMITVEQRIDAELKALEGTEGWYDFGGDYQTLWNKLSKHNSLPWSEELIKKYEDRWDWSALSQNQSLPWTESLIEKYEDRWDWGALSGNESLPWSEALIEKYEDKWAWGDPHRYVLFDNLSMNEALPWSEALIEKYEDKWSWGALSTNELLPWSEELIKKYEDRWNWSALSQNESLPCSEALIEKYLEKDKPILVIHGDKLQDKWNWARLSQNKSLPWSKKFFKKYIVKWKPSYLAQNTNTNIPWKDESNFSYLVDSCWDYLEEENEHYNFWNYLAENESLPWTSNPFSSGPDPFSLKSEDWPPPRPRPSMGFFTFLSFNEGFPWSKEFIEKKKNQLNWRALSENESLPWSEKLIIQYKGKWSKTEQGKDRFGRDIRGEGIWGNKSIPWTLELLKKFKDNDGMQNKNIYEKVYKPYLNEDNIKFILNKINIDE
jgi:hypothetical protein